MSARFRLMLILAFVLVVLGGLSWWLSATPPTPPPPTPVPTVVVWDNSSATVQGLLVQSLTQTVALQNVNTNWKITAPLQADADNVQVGQEAGQLKAPAATT